MGTTGSLSPRVCSSLLEDVEMAMSAAFPTLSLMLLDPNHKVAVAPVHEMFLMASVR